MSFLFSLCCDNPDHEYVAWQLVSVFTPDDKKSFFVMNGCSTYLDDDKIMYLKCQSFSDDKKYSNFTLYAKCERALSYCV